MMRDKRRMAVLAAILLAAVLLLGGCIKAIGSKDEPHRFERIDVEQAKRAGLVEEQYKDAEPITAWVDTYSGYIYVELNDGEKDVVARLVGQDGEWAKIGGYDD